MKWILTVAGTDATDAAVALETQQALLFSTRKERLLLVCVSTSDSEANVHSAADRLVWHNAVNAGVPIEYAVDQIGLFIRDFFLATDTLCAVGIDKALHDLPGNPDVEDG